MGPFLQRRIVDPLKLLLRQGITPQKVALSLACGVVCGLFPVPGATTLLCAAVALLFRLNLPAVQLVNYFIYPAQLALILPFIRAGEFILRTDRTKLSLPQMIALFGKNHVQALHVLWRLALHGIVAWLVFAPVAFVILYRIFLPMTVQLAKTLPRRRQPSIVTE
ncbi:MAG: DUF2062 domain-containing protein [Silvibacterium sp.]